MKETTFSLPVHEKSQMWSEKTVNTIQRCSSQDPLDHHKEVHELTLCTQSNMDCIRAITRNLLLGGGRYSTGGGTVKLKTNTYKIYNNRKIINHKFYSIFNSITYC